jgi:hypothetical protein
MSWTRAQAREKIEEQLEFSGPYSHNLIGLYLGAIAKRYGSKAANKLIAECNLEEHGWKQVVPKGAKK